MKYENEVLDILDELYIKIVNKKSKKWKDTLGFI